MLATACDCDSTGESASPLKGLAGQLRVGDLVFVRIRAAVFLRVAEATGSWTNHVGVVTGFEGLEPLVSESCFPLSKTTNLRRFIRRSHRGRVAVARLRPEPTAEERARIGDAARKRIGVLYDTGFNLRSRRQFCSRYVTEVLAEATGKQLGIIETFEELLGRQPNAPLWFWQLWYFGRIPWQRQTVTPASVLCSPALRIVFDGHAR